MSNSLAVILLHYLDALLWLIKKENHSSKYFSSSILWFTHLITAIDTQPREWRGRHVQQIFELKATKKKIRKERNGKFRFHGLPNRRVTAISSSVYRFQLNATIEYEEDDVFGTITGYVVCRRDLEWPSKQGDWDVVKSDRLLSLTTAPRHNQTFRQDADDISIEEKRDIKTPGSGVGALTNPLPQNL